MEEPIIKAEVIETERVEVKSESTTKVKLEPSKDELLKSTSVTSNPKRPKLDDEESKDLGPTEEIHEIVGGSSIRRYLNKNLTLHLLEGLRQISQTKPNNPLRWLGEFLIERSNQLENLRTSQES